ncbi:GtrA family protein [Streptomyces sp. NPDC102406]|uniref:GtrA family protein n=1 Tax=Streptomyces sp. NPDC102406 TaxID=3366171 RepID=UPI003805CF6E
MRSLGETAGRRRAAGGLGPELLGFAVTGLCAYAADLALFLWLRGPLAMDPVSAKSLSFVAGCSVAYAGNALGTYRGRAAGGSRLRRYGMFLAVNVAGALVQLACIGVSHYVLGFTSPRADTLSGAGVGMALATAVRFWGTRTLAFGPGPGGRPADGWPAEARQVVPVEPVDRGRLGTWTG